MATSVQRFQSAAPSPPALKAASEIFKRDRTFAVAMKAAGLLNTSKISSPSAPEMNSGAAPDATSLFFDLNEEITADSLADVLRKTFPRSEPFLEKQEPSSLLCSPEKSDPFDSHQPDGCEPAESADPGTSEAPAATVPTDDSVESCGHRVPSFPLFTVGMDNSKAIRFGLPSSWNLPATDDPDKTEEHEIALSKGESIGIAGEQQLQTIFPKGDLVFQLALRLPLTSRSEPAGRNDPDVATPGRAIDLEPGNPRPSATETAIESAEIKSDKALLEENSNSMAVPNGAEPEPNAPMENSQTSPEMVIPRQTSSTLDHGRNHAHPETTRATPSLRVQDLAIPVPPVSPLATTLQKLAVVVRGANQSVRLDIRQQAGSVRVAVHSDDASLATRLREGIPELISRLVDSGFEATVTPTADPHNEFRAWRTEDNSEARQNSNKSSQQQQRQKNPQRQRAPLAWNMEE